MGGLVWEPMMVSDVFEEVMMSPTQYNQHDLKVEGEPVAVYVTRSQENNGVTQHVPAQDRTPIGGGGYYGGWCHSYRVLSAGVFLYGSGCSCSTAPAHGGGERPHPGSVAAGAGGEVFVG